MPLTDVKLLANTLGFFGKINQIASFDFYEELYEDLVDDIYSVLLGPDPTEPFSEKFDELGFGSAFVLNNMGTLSFFFFGYLCFILLQ